MYAITAGSPETLLDPLFAYTGVYLLILVILAIFYCMKSIGLSTMASNRGISFPWLGWVPLADFYILGCLIGPFKFFGFNIYKSSVLLPMGLLAVILTGYVPVLGVVTGMVFFLFIFTAIYQLFSIYTPENAIWCILLSLFLLFPVILYVIRNNYPQQLYDGAGRQ